MAPANAATRELARLESEDIIGFTFTALSEGDLREYAYDTGKTCGAGQNFNLSSLVGHSVAQRKRLPCAGAFYGVERKK